MTAITLRQGTQFLGPGPRIGVGRVWLNGNDWTVDFGVVSRGKTTRTSLVVGDSLELGEGDRLAVTHIRPGRGSGAGVVFEYTQAAS